MRTLLSFIFISMLSVFVYNAKAIEAYFNIDEYFDYDLIAIIDLSVLKTEYGGSNLDRVAICQIKIDTIYKDTKKKFKNGILRISFCENSKLIKNGKYFIFGKLSDDNRFIGCYYNVKTESRLFEEAVYRINVYTKKMGHRILLEYERFIEGEIQNKKKGLWFEGESFDEDRINFNSMYFPLKSITLWDPITGSYSGLIEVENNKDENTIKYKFCDNFNNPLHENIDLNFLKYLVRNNDKWSKSDTVKLFRKLDVNELVFNYIHNKHENRVLQKENICISKFIFYVVIVIILLLACFSVIYYNRKNQ